MDNNLFNSLKVIKIVGSDDHYKILECFKVVTEPVDAIESFSDTEAGLNHVMMSANTGFNLLLKHQETYKKFTNLDVDKMLQGFHLIELQFEEALER